MVGVIVMSIMPTLCLKLGERDISIVGLKFMGKHKFVVENQYTKYVLDFNKSEEGIETEGSLSK